MEIYKLIDNLIDVENDITFLFAILFFIFIGVLWFAIWIWNDKQFRKFIIIPVLLFFMNVYTIINKVNYRDMVISKIKSFNYNECSCRYLKYIITKDKLKDIDENILLDVYLNKCGLKYKQE